MILSKFNNNRIHFEINSNLSFWYQLIEYLCKLEIKLEVFYHESDWKARGIGFICKFPSKVNFISVKPSN